MKPQTATMPSASTTETPTLLIVEDDPGLRRQLRWRFDGFCVHTASDRDCALAQAQRHPPAVAILDLGLPPDPGGVSEGLALLKALRDRHPDCQVLVLTGHGDHASALEAIRLGASDFMNKPLAPELLDFTVSQAWQRYRLRQEAFSPPETPVGGLLGHSEAMRQVHRQLMQMAPAPPELGILIQGETGTGKELAARALHRLSGRKGDFVAVNMTTAPTLKESELFGHEKGAFTGADSRRIGAFQQADGGTLFLDEVGDTPLDLQPRLLRAIQEREIQPLGSGRTIPVDVRIVCATHQDLQQQVREGRFREDLYYRLCGDVIQLPPLRQRHEDILLLAYTFLRQGAQKCHKPMIQGFTPAATEALEAHPWPGNVRELYQTVLRAVMRCAGTHITPADLGLPAPRQTTAAATLEQSRRLAERQALVRAMAQAGGNVSRMSEILGVSRPNVYQLLKKHRIEPDGS